MGGLGDLGRRGVLALGAAVVLSSCRPDSTGTDDGKVKVRTDPEPLKRRFTALGPLSDTHWLGYVLGDSDSRWSGLGPNDLRVVGLAHLRTGGAAAIVEAPQHHFQATTPDQPPGTLAQFMPKSAGWVRSDSFDSEMTSGASADYAEFYFDPGTDTVYFDTLNASPAASPGP